MDCSSNKIIIILIIVMNKLNLKVNNTLRSFFVYNDPNSLRRQSSGSKSLIITQKNRGVYCVKNKIEPSFFHTK